MLNYSDLSAGKKKWVHLIQLTHPEIDQVITYEQIVKFDKELRELRKKDPKYKVSMPLWLIVNNAVSRGVYFFPGTENDSSNFLPEREKVDEKLELLYQNALKQFQI